MRLGKRLSLANLLRRFHATHRPVTADVHPVGDRHARRSLQSLDRNMALPQLEELELLYDSLPVGIYIVDRRASYLYINHWLSTTVGVSREAFIGRSVQEETTAALAPLASMCQRVLDTGESICNQEISTPEFLNDALAFGQSSGTLPPCCLVNHHPLKTIDGIVWGVRCTVQDISDQKRCERDLAKANDRIHNVLENITCGFVSLDAEQRFSYINRRAAEKFSTSVEQMQGKLVEEFFPTTAGAEFQAKFNEARLCGKVTEFEAYHERLGASLECHCFPTDEGLSVFFVDTTQTRKTLQRLRKTESDYRRLAAVVEQCDDFVGICSPEGEPLYINQAGRQMLGLSPTQDIGKTHFLRYFAPEDHEVMTKTGIPELKKNGRWKGAVRFKNVHTGAYIPTYWNVFAIADPDGDLPEVWATVSPDLTEQKLMEQVLRDSEQRALQANVAKSEFLANMSHEIRTPMAAILGYADVLLEQCDSATTQECLMVIKKNGEHLLKLINDILDLSRIEAGRLTVDLQPCELPRLLADISVLMQVRAHEKSLDFDVSLENTVPRWVNTDLTRVRQILINLLGNAIKFTQHGQVKLLTRFLPDQQPPMIEFEVSDTGIGMTEDQQLRLFQPFCQGDSSVTRAFGGSGLGLAISKRLAEMLDGQIFLESQPGAGSRFRVRIPAYITENNFVQPDELETTKSTQLVNDHRELDCRVLVVDDRRDVRYISQHFLESAGAKVSTADNGQLALDAVHRAIAGHHPFDVILMDMQMPNIDGYQAASALRTAGVDQPIIALTANAMKGDRERCLLAGCDDYLSKPIQQTQLIEMVGRYTQDFNIEQLRLRRTQLLQEIANSPSAKRLEVCD
jgi:PAS domain S-box-containing protein